MTKSQIRLQPELRAKVQGRNLEVEALVATTAVSPAQSSSTERRFDPLLVGVTVALPFQYIPLELSGGSSLSLNYPLFALLGFLVWRYRLARESADQFETAAALLCAIILARLAASLGAEALGQTVTAMAREAAKWLSFVLLYRLGRQADLRASLLLGLVISMILLVALSVNQVIEGSARLFALGYVPPRFNFASASGSMRPFSAFESPTVWGAYLASLLGFLTIAGRHWQLPRTFKVGLVGLGLAGLLLTQTRASWLAYGACVVLSLAVERRRTFGGARLLLGTLIVALVLLLDPHLGASVIHRFGTLFDERFTSNADRLRLWSGTLQAVTNTPWTLAFGYGAQPFEQTMLPYVGLTIASLSHPHDVYLTVFYFYGMLGLAAFVAVLVVGLRRLREAMRARDPRDTALATAGFAAITAYCVDGLFENLYTSYNVSIIVALYVGLGVSPRSVSRLRPLNGPPL